MTGTAKRGHIAAVFASFHWLPVKFRIDFNGSADPRILALPFVTGISKSRTGTRSWVKFVCPVAFIVWPKPIYFHSFAHTLREVQYLCQGFIFYETSLIWHFHKRNLHLDVFRAHNTMWLLFTNVNVFNVFGGMTNINKNKQKGEVAFKIRRESSWVGLI